MFPYNKSISSAADMKLSTSKTDIVFMPFNITLQEAQSNRNEDVLDMNIKTVLIDCGSL
jgi:hypothetical protein